MALVGIRDSKNIGLERFLAVVYPVSRRTDDVFDVIMIKGTGILDPHANFTYLSEEGAQEDIAPYRNSIIIPDRYQFDLPTAEAFYKRIDSVGTFNAVVEELKMARRENERSTRLD